MPTGIKTENSIVAIPSITIVYVPRSSITKEPLIPGIIIAIAAIAEVTKSINANCMFIPPMSAKVLLAISPLSTMLIATIIKKVNIAKIIL